MHSHPGSVSGSLSGHSTTNLNGRMALGGAGLGNAGSGHGHSGGTATPTGVMMGHSRRNSGYPLAGTPRGVQGMSLVSLFPHTPQPSSFTLTTHSSFFLADPTLLSSNDIGND